MKIIISKDYEEMSKLAALEVSKYIEEKPKTVLGLATGKTPEGLYKHLIDIYRNGEVDFSQVKSINLDEYIGLSIENENSYRYFMDSKFFNHINIDKNNTFVPNGLAKDIQKECIEYDNKIKELGGVDLQVLGIGGNGHIGFNEPNDFLTLGTHVTNLKEETIKANSVFFNSIDEVPKKAITLGIGGIMKAKKIILLASGENKALAIKELLGNKVTTKVPATMLQLHQDVTLLVDEKAAKFVLDELEGNNIHVG